MASRHVLIVNKSFPEIVLKILQKAGMQTTVVPYLDSEEESLPKIKESLRGVDGLIWNTKHRINAEILNLAGPQLKAISTMSSGLDHVDLGEVKSRCIPLGNTPKVLDNAVADITIGLLIAASRRFKEGVREIESGSWKFGVNWMLGQDIAGSTVGILGFGGIGQAIVRRLKGFDVAKFLYQGPREKPEAKALGVERSSLEELLKSCDHVILCCPLTAETKNLINKDTLKLMKKTAVLINIARGGIIDQDALFQSLKEGEIFSAGLDVVTPEPIAKDHPLVTLPNCYILPHMGIATIQTRVDMATISANNIINALNGKPMQCPAF